jgi:hypothetical protein
MLRMVSRRQPEPAGPQPIPNSCSGVPAREFTILPFLASMIVRVDTTVSGSNEELIAAAGPIAAGAMRFFVEGIVTETTLELDIRSDDGIAYREHWTATLRVAGDVGVVEGLSSGSFTINECVATWVGEPFVAEIRSFIPPPIPGVSCGAPESASNPGMMTAVIDGVPWCAPINQAVRTGSVLIVSAIDHPEAFDTPGTTSLSFSAPAEVGTHTVGFVNPLTGILVTLPASNWLAAGPVGSGSLTITTLTETSATGTFSFTLVPGGGTGPNRVVTDGAFSVRIPTP